MGLGMKGPGGGMTKGGGYDRYGGGMTCKAIYIKRVLIAPEQHNTEADVSCSSYILTNIQTYYIYITIQNQTKPITTKSITAKPK